MRPNSPLRVSRSNLVILEQPYRGSLLEQYGHIVWLSRIMRGMGADHGLLLKGDCVMFARTGQPRISLPIGGKVIEGVSHYESGVSDLLAMVTPIFIWQPDVDRLHLSADAFVDGVQFVGHMDMPKLIRNYDALWYW